MKEKQIEEMAKLIANQRGYGCNEQDHCDMSCQVCKCGCIPYEDAQIVYNAGYRKQSEWISVEERLPEPEKEVLVFAIRRYKYGREIQEVPIITTAMYEDGTISNEDSVWNWYDIDFIYDEENDIGYVPEGWWEFRHYNPDDVYNNAVDDKVTHWMPLPEAPKMKGGAE